MSVEPQSKKPRLEGTAGAMEDWDSGLETLGGAALAARRLAGLQALQRAYRKEMRMLEAAYGLPQSMAEDTVMADADDSACPASLSDLEEDSPSLVEALAPSGECSALAAALPGVNRLERLSAAASMREMAAQGAAAALVGRRGRYFIRSTYVTVGRANGRGSQHVDVDLALESQAKASKISRQQAVLELQKDGMWHLTNIGRGQVSVNACPLPRGDVALAPHLSLLEFGSAKMLLLANPVAVCRGGMRPLRR